MRKGRRERIVMYPLFLHGGAQASKFGFYKLIECIIKKVSWCETECKKNVPLVKQNVMKF